MPSCSCPKDSQTWVLNCIVMSCNLKMTLMLLQALTRIQLCTSASLRVSQLEEAGFHWSIWHYGVGLPVRTTSLPGPEVRMSRLACALPPSAPVSCFSGLWARRDSVNPDGSAVLCFSRGLVLTVPWPKPFFYSNQGSCVGAMSRDTLHSAITLTSTHSAHSKWFMKLAHLPSREGRDTW